VTALFIEDTVLRTAAVAFPLVALALLPHGPVAVPRPAPAVTLSAPGAADQDDMCVWVHPTDPGKSTVVTSDKAAGKLFVYDLAGNVLQTVGVKHPGNIDLRYGFRLAGRACDIAAVNLRADRKLAVFAVDPDTRTLTRVDDGSIATGENYGVCLYRSAKTGRFYAVTTSYSGTVSQFELTDGGAGKVRGKKARSWKAGGVCEAAVADDRAGRLYVAEESKGVWELGAEPDDPAPGERVIKVGANGLKGDVEGLALFHLADGKGYLIVSDQGPSTFRVYRREGRHEYLGSFTVAGAADTDGIEVVGVPLGRHFPDGLFACHTGAKSPCPVLLTRWGAIAETFTPPLATAGTEPRK
jgi:3-phytase